MTEAAKIAELAEHLRGMIDSLDEHVGREEIAAQLDEARKMALALGDEDEQRSEHNEHSPQTPPAESHDDCEFGCASDAEHLRRAYDALSAEYTAFRREVSERVEHIKATLNQGSEEPS